MKRFLCFILIVTLYTAPLTTWAQGSPFGTPAQGPIDPGTGTDPGFVVDPTTGTSAGTGITPGASTAAGTTSGTPSGNTAGTGPKAGPANNVAGNGLLPTSTTVSNNQGPGNSVYAGNGGGLGFWQSFQAIIFGDATLNGDNFQSTDMNQGTPVDQGTPDSVLAFDAQNNVTEGLKAASPTYTDWLTCSISTKTFTGYIKYFTCMMVIFIPIVIGLMVLWFMFGSLRYINDTEHEERTQYKTFLMWGVLILFVALSFVGILGIFSKTLGL